MTANNFTLVGPPLVSCNRPRLNYDMKFFCGIKLGWAREFQVKALSPFVCTRLITGILSWPSTFLKNRLVIYSWHRGGLGEMSDFFFFKLMQFFCQRKKVCLFELCILKLKLPINLLPFLSTNKIKKVKERKSKDKTEILFGQVCANL